MLSGEKASVTMLVHAQAIVVLAKTIEDGPLVRVWAFLVPLNTPGIETSFSGDSGWLPMGRGVLQLDRVRVPRSALLGQQGAAFRGVLNGK